MGAQTLGVRGNSPIFLAQEHYLRTVLSDKTLRKISTIFLHRWEFLVISTMRTNSSVISGNLTKTGKLEQEPARCGVAESESLEEEDIEIGNS
jgi:hypothetical protein